MSKLKILLALLGIGSLYRGWRSKRLPYYVDQSGWLHGPNVQRVPAHPSWYYSETPIVPKAIVAHYTATNPGTGISMASRRTYPKLATQRSASWHVSIETDGTIIQQVPFNHGAWHAGTGKINGQAANRISVGIELVGHGGTFPTAQVQSAKHVWRALVRAYPIAKDAAMVHHSDLSTNRSDPGPVWAAEHQASVLDYAYA